MGTLSLGHFVVLGGILFALGLFTVITRRNAIGILMGVELVLNSANINYVAFARYANAGYDGQVFANLRHHARRRRGGDRPRHRARHLPELRDDRRRGDGPAPAMTPAGYVGAIPLVPLAGAAVLGLGGAPLQRRFGKLPVSVLACGTVAVAFVLSVVAFFQLAGLAP